MSTSTLEAMFAAAAKTEDFEIERAKLTFTENMLALMEDLQMSRVDLARKLDVKPSRITALLRGTQNFTFDTAVRVARALGAAFEPKLVQKTDKIVCTQMSDNIESQNFGTLLPILDKTPASYAADSNELALAA